ncbi:MAG: outer membrane protein assembly factor BamC [Sodalis sp. (in: enterobacteria)]
MFYSIQKTMIPKVAGVSLIILLTACTSDQRYKRQVKGNEEYLKAPPLRALTSPSGMILPPQNSYYKIPDTPLNGAIGKDLDIRPPYITASTAEQCPFTIFQQQHHFQLENSN